MTTLSQKIKSVGKISPNSQSYSKNARDSWAWLDFRKCNGTTCTCTSLMHFTDDHLYSVVCYTCTTEFVYCNSLSSCASGYLPWLGKLIISVLKKKTQNLRKDQSVVCVQKLFTTIQIHNVTMYNVHVMCTCTCTHIYKNKRSLHSLICTQNCTHNFVHTTSRVNYSYKALVVRVRLYTNKLWKPNYHYMYMYMYSRP